MHKSSYNHPGLKHKEVYGLFELWPSTCNEQHTKDRMRHIRHLIVQTTYRLHLLSSSHTGHQHPVVITMQMV